MPSSPQWKRQYRMKLRARVREAKIAHGGCVDCGLSITPDNFVVFDFDHRDPSVKRSKVDGLVGNESWSTLQAEMDKCDLRCANCHRLRTYAQRHVADDAMDAA